jgi:hypothetical protein
MNTFIQVGTALTIAALSASGASAASKKYGSEAGWDIFVNDQLGPGCVIARKLPAEAHVEMGIFDVDGEKFSGQATGQQIEGFRGAYVPVNNPDFIYDLAKKNRLTITPEGRDPIVISLTGTDAAFAALRACQESQ